MCSSFFLLSKIYDEDVKDYIDIDENDPVPDAAKIMLMAKPPPENATISIPQVRFLRAMQSAEKHTEVACCMPIKWIEIGQHVHRFGKP